MTFRIPFSFFFFLTTLVTAQKVFEPAVDAQRRALPFAQRFVNADSVVGVIVEFKEAPMFLAQQRSPAKVSGDPYREQFDRLTNDLRAFSTARANGSSPVRFDAGEKFYKAFFGLALRIPQGIIPDIERLPYVKKVHPNQRVKASLHKSVPHIRANDAWAFTGLKGEGVVVGIIDSGIDYLHPALGGGIGPSYKVVGGYDFVNNDDDPMDDNGHGTHVAGIVAANSPEILGVAPEAKLFALKVLDAEGGGSFEQIIAAIERTVDPNNDGDMSDKLDVVNMSLGSYQGDPDDAASTAVDQAVRLGVTFVIAAGNDGNAELIEGKEGNYYYNGSETIGSPGTSRFAITVGAIDSVNTLAYFSSKGPTRRIFGIKPEVVAPGVNIRSLYPGNDFLVESGTSMASPMVAGVAALIKSTHPHFTPARVKSAIVNRAVDLGMSVNHQGGGRVDALNAVSTRAFAEPSQLSFGLDNPADGSWSVAETVKVVNAHDDMQNFSVGFSGMKTGITVTAVPQTFSLASGETKNIVVTVTVNNALVPIVNEDIILYGGFAHFNGTVDTLRLPWSFVRTTRMILTFSETDPQFVGSSTEYYITPLYNKFYSKVHWLDAHHLEVAGAFTGLYDFVVYFPKSSKIVVKESLPFTGTEAFAFDATAAVHTLQFQGVDDHGVPFTTLGKTLRSVKVNFAGAFVFATLPEGVTSVDITPASDKFSFQGVEAMVDVKGSKKIYLPQYAPVSGMSGNVNLSNPSNAYYRQTLNFLFPPEVTATRFYSDIVSVESLFGDEYFNTVLLGVDTLQVTDRELSFDLHMMQPAEGTPGASVSFHTNTSYQSDYFLDLSTRYFSIIHDSVLAGFPSQYSAASYLSPSGGTMRFGESPVHIMNLSYNNSFGTSIHFNPLFRGGLNELRYKDAQGGIYAIYDGSGEKVKEEPLDLFPRYPFEAAAGKYRLVMQTGNDDVRNAKGKIILVNDVDLAQTVADAPYITSMILLDSSGRATNAFSHNAVASLRFSAKVFAYPNELPVADSTRAWYRRFGTSDWMTLPVAKLADDIDHEGALYSAALSGATTVDSVAVDLRIRVVDASGNAAEQILSPAFSVGNWVYDGTTPVNLPEEKIPSEFLLGQNFPNPFNPSTTISFHLPEAGPATLIVYDMIGREVATLVDRRMEAGSYTIPFTAEHLASGIYLYRLSSGSRHAVRKMVVVK